MTSNPIFDISCVVFLIVICLMLSFRRSAILLPQSAPPMDADLTRTGGSA